MWKAFIRNKSGENQKGYEKEKEEDELPTGRCLIHRSSTRDDIGDALNGQRMLKLKCCGFWLVKWFRLTSAGSASDPKVSVRRQPCNAQRNATPETRVSSNPLSTSTPQRFITCDPLPVSAHIMADDFARLVFQAKPA